MHCMSLFLLMVLKISLLEQSSEGTKILMFHFLKLKGLMLINIICVSKCFNTDICGSASESCIIFMPIISCEGLHERNCGNYYPKG